MQKMKLPNPALKTSASVDGSEFLAIPTFADNPEGAKAFIELATSLENQIKQGATTPWVPAIEAAYSDESVKANAPVAEAILQSYKYPVDGGYSADRERWLEVISTQISRALAQDISPKEALDVAVEQINASRA